MAEFLNFSGAYAVLAKAMLTAPQVMTESWQGVEANLATRELPMVSFGIGLGAIEDLDHWRRDIGPNLPWADDHFRERVGGEPLNPGREWRNWPWGNSASRFIGEERFNHTYAERLWPHYARRTQDGQLPKSVKNIVRRYPLADNRPIRGIEGYYGDLDNLVGLLVAEPHTRQAWIPLFYPEDTGDMSKGRKPCSLGWQFIVRDYKMSVYYPLRSCDLVRHLRDDWYLAVRLLLWVLDQCRLRGREDKFPWHIVTPGSFHFHATSLHVFETDVEKLRLDI